MLEASSAPLRVVAFNVRSLRDDAAAVAAVIRDLKVDVALIQETPRFFRWRSKLAQLASDAGLVYVTGGRAAGAMSILSSLEVRVVSTHQILLPKTPGLHQRGIAAAILKVRDQRVAVASIHLGLAAKERLEHAEVINRAVASIALDLPLVIGGDLNEQPGDPAWRAMAAGRLDAWVVAEQPLEELTYSAILPQRRIDAILCSTPIKVLSAGVPQDDRIKVASDHRPVFAELQLTP